jgi:hypothetical protein
VVLVTLIALIARSSRRRSAAAADWQSRLIDAYAKGSALHDAMSVAESPGALTAADAGARWADIQRRADDLAQTLYALREAVPDPGDQARISDTLASLQAARSAMDAERTLGGASPEQAETIRNRLYVFESSLRALRARDDRYPYGRPVMSGTLWAITLSIIYVVLLVTLGILTFRKGHWVLGLIGFLFPVLWLLGAVLPDHRHRPRHR